MVGTDRFGRAQECTSRACGGELISVSLGVPWASRTLHELPADLWITPEWHINVSYTESADSIGILHIRRLHLYDRRAIGLEASSPNLRKVRLDQLAQVFGAAVSDQALVDALTPLDWNAELRSEADGADESFDFLKRDGLTLYFRERDEFAGVPELSRLAPGSTFFAGFRVNRAGDMQSEGFNGELPFGLQFHDSPDQIIERIGRAPDERGVASDTGHFIWRYGSGRLHIVFSLIDWQLYRVTCFAAFVK